MKKTLLILVIGMMGTAFATAQTADNGKVVGRVLFDREDVTIVYADNSFDEHVATATITKGKPEPTAVKTQDKNTATTGGRSWYSVDGRRIANGQKPKAKGVYVVKEEKKVRKVVKK